MIRYLSTRSADTSVSASQAIVRGLAPDGGLYIPDRIPTVDEAFLHSLLPLSYPQRAAAVLGLFLEEFSAAELAELTARSYADNFDTPRIAPLTVTDDATAMLELWHGPTCAFKDMALQLMPRLLVSSLRKNGETRTASILVATSGDTGKAALEGFRDVPGTRIMVFYPRDGVSEVQRLQMVTQLGANVNVCAVEGNFDDAQTGVKRIFSDRAFASELDGRGFFLSSANSINWGRLVPQVAYYFSAYCDMAEAGVIAFGDAMDFCVPTGNFGNILAGWFAKKMGLPVRRLICASNRNNVLTDFIRTGVYDRNRPFHVTDSPSMDILVSSNLERLLCCLSGDTALTGRLMTELNEAGRYTVPEPLLRAVQADFAAGFCSDEDGRRVIARFFRDKRLLLDTHTAVAFGVLESLRAAEGGKPFPTAVVSTADPFKFGSALLAALGASCEASGCELLRALAERTGRAAPAPLAGLEGREIRFTGCVRPQDMTDAVARFLR